MYKFFSFIFPAALGLFVVALFFTSCSLKPVLKTKDITYSSTTGLKLDVYRPKATGKPKKILVFVYGGNWVHGKKSTYRFFGKGMARKGLVCVVLDYRLSPKTDIAGMAADVAEAVTWVKRNSSSWNADSSNIYISGHSAGGQLAALVAADNRYFKQLGLQNPIKGVVLIDAFGMDMYSYLSASKNIKDTLYLPAFSTNPATWKKFSPVYYLDAATPPMMQFIGSKTYPAVKQQNDLFYKELKKYQPGAPFIILKGKKHVHMIAQFYNAYARPYKDILYFINTH